MRDLPRYAPYCKHPDKVLKYVPETPEQPYSGKGWHEDPFVSVKIRTDAIRTEVVEPFLNEVTSVKTPDHELRLYEILLGQYAYLYVDDCKSCAAVGDLKSKIIEEIIRAYFDLQGCGRVLENDIYLFFATIDQLGFGRSTIYNFLHNQEHCRLSGEWVLFRSRRIMAQRRDLEHLGEMVKLPLKWLFNPQFKALLYALTYDPDHDRTISTETQAKLWNCSVRQIKYLNKTALEKGWLKRNLQAYPITEEEFAELIRQKKGGAVLHRKVNGQVTLLRQLPSARRCTVPFVTRLKKKLSRSEHSSVGNVVLNEAQSSRVYARRYVQNEMALNNDQYRAYVEPTFYVATKTRTDDGDAIRIMERREHYVPYRPNNYSGA